MWVSRMGWGRGGGRRPVEAVRMEGAGGGVG